MLSRVTTTATREAADGDELQHMSWNRWLGCMAHPDGGQSWTPSCPFPLNSRIQALVAHPKEARLSRWWIWAAIHVDAERSTCNCSGDVNEVKVLSGAPRTSLSASAMRRLEGMWYQLTLDLPILRAALPGSLAVSLSEGSPGRALPPLAIRGAGGWVSGCARVWSGQAVCTGPLWTERPSSSEMASATTITTGGSGRMSVAMGTSTARRFVAGVTSCCCGCGRR